LKDVSTSSPRGRLRTSIAGGKSRDQWHHEVLGRDVVVIGGAITLATISTISSTSSTSSSYCSGSSYCSRT
jgi:hypothetical protein